MRGNLIGSMRLLRRYAPRNDEGERIAEPVPKRKRGISLLAVTERRGAFSGGEGGHSRIVGAGFSGTGSLGNEAARQKSRVYLKLKSLSLDGSSLST